jgi:ribonuclease BN (tRNA processing enzyme)
VKVTIVGSGCGIPNPKRGSPCVAVSAGKELVALDCGPGALRSMAAAGVPWAEVGTIFITHFHTDHIADIAPLLFALNIPDVNRVDPLRLCGPPGIKNLFEKLVAAYGDWLVPKRYELVVEELRGEPLEGERWRAETARAEHSRPAYAYRFEADGGSLVYSGDTDYSESIVQLASPCDLLILECSYPNEIEVAGHLNPRKAGEMARKAGCKKLVLTHVYPVCADYDLVAECRQTYHGDVVLAEDGLQFEVGSPVGKSR